MEISDKLVAAINALAIDCETMQDSTQSFESVRSEVKANASPESFDFGLSLLYLCQTRHKSNMANIRCKNWRKSRR